MHHLSNRFVRLRHRAPPRWGLWLLAAATPWLGTLAQAQIRTDTSLGQAAQTLTGPNYAIPQTLGKLAGNNLFHSFQTFNLATGEAANFSTTSPTLANVISRVTGGELSQINGTLRLSAAGGATPAFFFINPAGVTFGAGASVDVPGAFHVSTANYLRFPDGRFYADTTSGSTFSSAEPSAFGFLGATRASVSVKDAVLDGKRAGLSLVGGDLAIEHAEVRASTGNIRLVAVGAGPSEVSPSGPLPVANGTLELDKQAFVYTRIAAKDPPGGSIAIAAGDATIRAGSLVSTQTSGAQAAGAINAELGSLEIDGRTATASTGITSQSAMGNSGRGGDVSVAVRGDIQILGGGQITSDTYWSSDSGKVAISANTLMLDGAGHKSGARVTNRGSDGDASGLTVEVVDSIVLKNGSQISGSNFGAGQAGTVSLRAGKLIRVETDSMVTADTYMDGTAGSINLWAPSVTVDGTGGKRLTQISSQALSDGLGNAGTIHITAPGELRVLHGSRIVTGTSGKGSGGSIDVTAGALLLDGSNTTRSTGLFSTNERFSSGNAGSIRIDTPGELRLLHDAQISANTYGSGNAGNIQIAAGSLLMGSRGGTYTTGIFSTTGFNSAGNAGSIGINVAGDAQLIESSRVASTTWSSGNAGSIVFRANNLVLDGRGNFLGAGFSSETGGGSSGNGGSVHVTVPGHVQVIDVGFISSGTSGQGNAGSVAVSAGRLTIDGKSIPGVTGIDSASYGDSPGNGGTVVVTVAGDATVAMGHIQSKAQTVGRGGDITLLVGGKLEVGAGGRIYSGTSGSGDSGMIDINASQVVLSRGVVEDYAWILSDSRGSGAAGAVRVQASQSIELAEGGFITSDVYGAGRGGSVTVSAPQIRIGGAGMSWGAAISSDASRFLSDPVKATGDAGAVTVVAQNLIIEGGLTDYPTGITSRTYSGNSGNAGSIAVYVRDQLQISNGGVITSSTNDSGRGGEVQVRAGTIEINGSGSQIGAAASSLSSGRPGNITVQSDGAVMLRNGGSLTIENDGNSTQPSTVAASTLTVTAAVLTLDGGAIKANSTGNVAAGTVQINASERITLNQGSITTSANSGDGGAINVSGGKLVALNNSQITTSVLGATGNGGDIQIGADALVLNSGFIQANTAASNASGGLVNIGIKTLLASGSTLFVGGQSAYDFTPGVFSFNVIQAAAPTGVSGAIDITSPVLDLSGSLGRLNAALMDDIALGRNPCQVSAGSSLAVAGRGGLPVSYRGLLRAQAAPSAPSTPSTVPAVALAGTSPIARVRLPVASCL